MLLVSIDGTAIEVWRTRGAVTAQSHMAVSCGSKCLSIRNRLLSSVATATGQRLQVPGGLHGFCSQPTKQSKKRRLSSQLGATDRLRSVDVSLLLGGQPQLLLSTEVQRKAILGIDPDANGAVALLQWESQLESPVVHVERVDVQVFDMPQSAVQLSKTRTRRQPEPGAISELIHSRILQAGVELTAVLELPTPNALNGKHSWFGCGFASGLWQGILAANGIKVETVSARKWKTDLQLLRQGKDGSRQLAQMLFPQTEPWLRRKKDHGRAEAILVAAWGMGIRMPALEGLPVTLQLDVDDEGEERESSLLVAS